jgi:Glycosyl hydrolase family 26
MTPCFHTSTPRSRNWLKADTIGLVAFALLVTFMFATVGGAAQASGGRRKPPTSTAPPTITGSAMVGQTLTASRGSWSGNVNSYAYQWLRCDSSGAGCTFVTGALSASYVPVSGDLGYTLRVSVTASNNWGSTVATSNQTSPVTPLSPPANTSPPTASGTTRVGQTLSGATGTWTGSPTSYAYQWDRCNSAGGSCTEISGATASSYALQAADVGSTLRVAVTATNAAGSGSASSSQTAVVTNGGSGYPASFFTGPAGTNNILPPNGTYPATGAWIGEASANGLTQVYSREQYLGRRFNIVSIYAQNRCDPWPTVLAADVAAGYIPMVSWFPTPAYADQITSGQADNCIRSFGNAIANQSGRVLVRPYWEFNGGWQTYSHNSDGTRATADQEKLMWQHTIDVLRTTNFFSKASVVWSVSEGYFNNGDAWNNPTPYPGDGYVDWVGSSAYNWNSSTAWCGFHAGWCSFAEAVTHGRYAPTHTPIGVEASFRGRKPYLVGESGSVEDPNTSGRKGQWMNDMGTYAKTYMPGLYALVYFDETANNANWSLDSSTSAMNGYEAFAGDPYFNVPNQ